MPIEANDFLDVNPGSIIQNSRLKEIFEGAVINHNYDIDDNVTVQEQFSVLSNDRHATTYEVFLDNNSVVVSSGVFKNNSTYDINVNGEVVKSFKFKKDSNITFTYENHTVDIVFRDTNSTSIKYFSQNNKGNFLNFNL